ncbi:DHA2 family efflux MFS transporter permease subunit [Chitinophaga sp. LS1]|uniref:DHA2 family efflux MFS transporter permease subunit n=1 Tax=Chitinophaga sp. LS1 TaxID=3051176 RepID=UPI002AAAC82B|nr:DHA2 family efflux MFS transporter permease subunit [Chitinophaga sp. LS1]WPV66251.1 DHA2 family efflux MFS transporter permease subunit [Chitinophaga sp. LS1]
MTAETQYPTGTAKWILVLTCVACAVMELIDSTIVNVSLREISGNIGASVTEIGWVSTAYGIGNVIVIPLSGMLANLIGRRLYFTSSVVVFTLTSLLCGLSSNLWILVLWRFIQGVAGGGLLSTAMSIVLGAFPPEQAKTGFLTFALGIMIGPIFGPVLGGYITDTLSWHWIFFVNVPLGMIGAVLSWKYITDLPDAVRPPKIDWAGIAFIAMALGSLQYVLEEGSIHDWFDSAEIRIFFAISICSFIAFVWRELTTDHPAVELRLYSNFNLVLGNVIGMMYGIMANGTLFIFPLLAQVSLGWTATQTGAFLISGGIVGAVGMIAGKKLLVNVSPKIQMIAGLIIVIISLLPMALISPDASKDDFFWPFIIRNIGVALVAPNMIGIAVGTLRGKDLAQATGLSTMTRQLGGAIGVALISIYTTRNSAFVRSNLVAHISEYNTATQERTALLTQNFISAGYASDEARTAAYQMLDHSIISQQTLLSYNHGFITFAFLFALCIPVIMLIKTTKSAH